MQYRPFGKTGINISTLGFGCMRLPEYQLEDGSWAVDQDKTIKQGHDLSHEIKDALKDKFDQIEEVMIHLNPYFPE